MPKLIYKPRLRDVRRELRTEGTAAEATLWLSLKNKQLGGRRFRRQVDVGPFIVDFYCPQEKLVVELDGHHHFTMAGAINDERRDAFLATKGLRVIRFENKLVFDDLEGVLAEIASHFEDQFRAGVPAPHPSGPDQGRDHLPLPGKGRSA